MKYIDYPENFSDILVEKLKKEYTNKISGDGSEKDYDKVSCKSKTLNEIAKANDVNCPPLNQQEVDSAFVSLTENEISSLVCDITNNLCMLENKIQLYYQRTQNRNVKLQLDRLLTTIKQNIQNFTQAFNTSCTVTPSTCTPTRRTLRCNIYELFYLILHDLILLYSQRPNEFGLQQTTLSLLGSFSIFVNLPFI